MRAFVDVYTILIIAWIIASWVRLPYNVWISRIRTFLDDTVSPFVGALPARPADVRAARSLADARDHRAAGRRADPAERARRLPPGGLMLRRAPTAARPLGRARHAREQARPSIAGWTGMLALAVAAIAADQLTKATVVHALRVGEAVDVLPGLSFWHVRNTGHRVRRLHRAASRSSCCSRSARSSGCSRSSRARAPVTRSCRSRSGCCSAAASRTSGIAPTTAS